MINKINQKAKLLKNRGLIKFDLRQKLTPQKKAAITRQWNKYGSDINFEENIKANSGAGGEFKQINTNKKTFKTQLRRAGYLVEGNKAYINKDGFDSIEFKNGRIIRKSKGKISEEILFTEGDVFNQLKQFSEKEINDRTTWKAVRIGNFSPMGFSTRKGKYKDMPLNERPASAQRFDNFNQLLNYVSNWQPKDVEKLNEADARKLKNKLISSMSLTTIDRDQYKTCKKCGKKKNSLNKKGVCKSCK